MIKGYEGKNPDIHESCFVADSADIIGDIKIGNNSNIWYNAVLRADGNPINIGENTNIQDGTIVHINRFTGTTIGNNVTIGHNAIIHACTIGDNTLIGMGVIVLDGAQIGEFTLIGAGSLVPPGKIIPSGVLAMGSPIKVVRELSEEEKQDLTKSAIDYVAFAENHK